MNKRAIGVLSLGAALLSGCTMTGPNNFEVHEVLLYGGVQERIGWVYGDLPATTGAASGSTNVKLGGSDVTLRPQVSDALAVTGTLSVGGRATFRAPTTAVNRAVTVTKDFIGDNYSVQVGTNVDAVFFTDGRTWFKLSDRLVAGSVVSRVPANVGTLRGAGSLTNAEADALSSSLLSQGPLAVAVLPISTLPDRPLDVSPAPRTYLRTGLFVQPGLATAIAPTPAAPSNSNPSVTVTEYTRGANSIFSSPNASVFVSRTATDLAARLAVAFGNQTNPPNLPSVDFARETIVTFFLGQRPTGGYGVSLVSARASGSTLTVTVRVTAPGPGAITSQVITSPFLLVRASGLFDRVVVQDTNGTVLAQSN
ncbi:protease complex subunit PrcB family protein [Deinococcus yavapaiensis]|nr:protease complex subunit PrcB family protein [Deinococcus yavapaiensis]